MDKKDMDEAKDTNQTPNADEKNEFKTHIEEKSIELLDLTNKLDTEINKYYEALFDEDVLCEAEKRAKSLKRANANIKKSFSKTFLIEDELSSRISDMNKEKKKRHILPPPSNATIDYKEQSQNHFASGLNFYKLGLICFLGSFIGVVIELIWCFFTRGYIESRSGLVYGPFNLLYGIGAVFLTVFLYRFRNRRGLISFFVGMVVGSAVEYVCSWVQETLFGSRSWDYSSMPFNINGRICLLYSVFWGLLGVLWIKDLYPRIGKWILKIPDKIGKITTWCLVVFLALNALVSSVAVFRWSQRVNGVEASNGFWEFIDSRFTDERMEKIYANMGFDKKNTD